MKKLKILGAISFALIGGGALVSVPFITTSCGKKSGGGDNALTYYNTTGTNWEGYINGTLTLDLNDSDNTATISSNSSYVANNLIIPDSVWNEDDTKEYTLTAIEYYAFYGCSGLTGSLTIGSGVTSIGRSAFEDCSGLNGSLTIGNSVTSINDFAFDNCSGLTGDLTIPDSVTLIDGFAFRWCDKLTSFDFLNLSNKSFTLGSDWCYGCENIQYMIFPSVFTLTNHDDGWDHVGSNSSELYIKGPDVIPSQSIANLLTWVNTGARFGPAEPWVYQQISS